MRAHSRSTLTGMWLGAGAGLLLATAVPATALGAPPEGAPAAAPAPGTATTTPGTTTTTPGTRPTTAPGPTHPPRTGSVPGTDPTRAEAGAGTSSTTVATDAPPVPGMPAREKQQAQRALADLHKVNTLEITLGRLAQDKAQTPAIKDYAQLLVTEHQSADKKIMDFATAHDLVITSAASLREPAMTGTDTGLRRPATPGTGAAAETAPGTPGASGTGSPGAPGAPVATPGAVAGTSAPGSTAGSVSDQSPSAPMLDAEGRRTLARLEKLEGTKFEKQFLTEMVRGHQKTLTKIKSAERRAQSPQLQSLLGELRTSVESHLTKAREIQKGGAS